MIRFILYLSLVLSAGLGLYLELHNRRLPTPRCVAMLPALAMTLGWGLFMLAHVVRFWLDTGAWGHEAPVSAQLAMMSTGVILAWTLTAVVILVDRHRHG